MGDILPEVGQNAEIPAEGLGKGRDAVVQELQVFIAVPAEIEDLDGVGPDRAGFRLPDPRHHAFDADLSSIPEDRDPAFRADAGGRPFVQIDGQIVLRQLRRDPFACDPAEGIRAGRGGG